MTKVFELIKSPTLSQSGFDKFVDIWAWKGAIPPLQFSRMPLAVLAMLETIDGAARTLMFSVAVLDRLPESVTLTKKLLRPTWAENGRLHK